MHIPCMYIGFVEEAGPEYMKHMSKRYKGKDRTVVGRKTIMTWCGGDAQKGVALIAYLQELGVAEPFDDKNSAYTLKLDIMRKKLRKAKKKESKSG
ncbi:MAG: hypothetical protein QXD77_02000 [Candidatus Aenigmatarchaeota archaeon]